MLCAFGGSKQGCYATEASIDHDVALLIVLLTGSDDGLSNRHARRCSKKSTQTLPLICLSLLLFFNFSLYLSISISLNGKKAIRLAILGAFVVSADTIEFCWAENKDQLYDYIVAGAGAGGGVVASRLAEAGFKVLLLDAGPDYDTPLASTPGLWPNTCVQPEIEWNFTVKTSSDPGRDAVPYPRSSQIGGCTMHNAMLSFYTYPETFDRLMDLTGDPEWSEPLMRERFMRLENNEYAPSGTEGHGFEGYLNTGFSDGRTPLVSSASDLAKVRPVLDSLFQTFGSIEDVNFPEANELEGTHLPVFALKTEGGTSKRSSVRDLIIATATVRPNLVIKHSSFVTKVLLSKQKKKESKKKKSKKKESKQKESKKKESEEKSKKPVAYGVEVREGNAQYEASTGQKVIGERKYYYARKEVIVAGGTFNTPQILMLSGIGPKDHLTEMDIQVMADVPGVGRNLQDKLEASTSFEMPSDWDFLQGCGFLQPTPAEDQCYIDYIEGKPSIYNLVGLFVGAQLKSSPELQYPDTYVQVLPFIFPGFGTVGWVDEIVKQLTTSTNGLSFNIARSAKLSGTVKLSSNDPFAKADIDFDGYDDSDLEKAANMIMKIRAVVEGTAQEVAPGSNVDTIDKLKVWVREQGWGHHACCTAKIGADDDEMAVLDGQLRVRGVDNLRVVDNSVFPQDPAFFPMVSILMMADKAVKDILDADEIVSMGCEPGEGA